MVRRFSICLLALTLLLGLAGCSEQKTVKITPQAEKFRGEILQLLQKRVEQVKPLLATKNPQVEPWLKKLYGQAIEKGAPLTYDQVVLNHKARVLGWMGPDLPNFEQTYKADIGQDYSHFTKLDPVYKEHRIANFEIYSDYGDGLGVCAPVLEDDKLLACFCLGFDHGVLQKRYGIDGKQFLALDFN